jgi:hypothetical protein
MFGILLIAVGFVVAYLAGGFWWVVAIVNAWGLGVMFNYRRGEQAPRWTGISMLTTAALLIRGVMLLVGK